ncbi:glycosyltransferase [Micromonospora sp. NPDC003197]
MTPPVVSLIVVSYQTRELILRALSMLRASHPTVPYEVIVVDNASTDGSANAVADAFPDVRVVRLAHNVGFARAVNVGAEQATGDWLLLLNPDTEPVGDVLGELVRFARAHPAHRIYAGRTLHADGTDDGRSVFALPSLWAYVCFATGLSTVLRCSPLANPEELPKRDRTAGGPVPAASGCLLLIERALFIELDGLAPDYFMYSEDIDFCARATERGAGPALVPSAQVRHVGGASSTSVGKRVMVLRGKTTYLRLRWSRPRAALGQTLLATGIAVRALGARLTGRAGYWRGVWAQRRSWLSGWPPVSQLPPVEILAAAPNAEIPTAPPDTEIPAAPPDAARSPGQPANAP